MPKPPHQVFDRRTGGSGRRLASVPQVIEPKAGHASFAPGSIKRLTHRVTTHRAAIAADEHPIWPAQLAMCSARTGRTCGDMVTVRLAASVLGCASNAEPVASNSTRLRRTVTRWAARSMSSRRGSVGSAVNCWPCGRSAGRPGVRWCTLTAA
jgi:hypothetical protein